MPSLPIVDLHCDLLLYLARKSDATIYDVKNIGVTIPYLKQGNVRHQVMAIFVPTDADSVMWGQAEMEAYQSLLRSEEFFAVNSKDTAQSIPTANKIGITAAIENASALALEDEPLDKAFERLDAFEKGCGLLFYIGFTHHTENRFGGGNYSDNVGLKDDGKRLLEYMDGKRIAVDLAHASDNLAFGILNHLEAKSLDVPVIASHSNFRRLCDHVRNLPDVLVQEVVRRDGLIGINFLRAYIHPTEPEYLIHHILHGLEEGIAPEQLCFGADFFYRPVLSGPSRDPLYFPAHEDAGKYPSVLAKLEAHGIGTEQLQQLAYQNAIDFMVRNW